MTVGADVQSWQSVRHKLLAKDITLQNIKQRQTTISFVNQLDIAEGLKELIINHGYTFIIPARDFIRAISGNILTHKNIGLKKNVKGFTLVDSVKTIETINTGDYATLYGWSTERALIFTGIKYGRSPMIAVRVHPVKPTVVVYHKPGAVDPLAVRLAERENIPLVVTNLPLDELKRKMISLGEE